MIIHELERQFIGRGEVKGFIFHQLYPLEGKHSNVYIYQINHEGRDHYEVFMRKLTPICIDFKKRLYSTEEFKVQYPKANSFGLWAWTYNNREQAVEKVKFILNKLKDKNGKNNSRMIC